MLHDVVTVRGIPLTVYKYEAVSEVIRQTGDFYEADILDELREMYPEQRTIVDVGANIGNHAAYWSAFVPHTAMHCFEPVPDNYELLLLNAPGVVCHPCALSDDIGRMRMEIDAVNMGRSAIKPGGSLTVIGRMLDDFELEDVTLLKIDVEGWEGKVIAGAADTVKRCHPAIVVEGHGFGDHLMSAGITGYRQTRAWPGANYLWEWS